MSHTQKKLVFIEWVDSGRFPNEWTLIEDLDSKPHVIQSVGWLLEDNEDYKLITANFSSNPPQACGAMTIPTQAILKMKRLGK